MNFAGPRFSPGMQHGEPLSADNRVNKLELLNDYIDVSHALLKISAKTGAAEAALYKNL